MVKHKKITWTAQAAQEKLRPALQIQRYFAEPENTSNPEVAEHLYPGALWTLSTTLEVENLGKSYQQHEAPYVVRSYYGYGANTVFQQGEPAVYLGEVRVTELAATGRQVVVPRRCFLIRGARYLVRSLDNLTYIKDE